MSGQLNLLQSPRFLPLFITQFLGAFNDNLFKNALIVLITFHALDWTTLSSEILVNLAAGIFILPFFFLSATAGQLADKYDKAKLARLIKIAEMLIMVIAAFGFYFYSLNTLFFSLFMLGCHSTFFGPIKYAILPQHLKETELIGGNALIEAASFIAILLGNLIGVLLVGTLLPPIVVALCGFVVASFGYIASRRIPPAPAPEPFLHITLNIFKETWNNIISARKNALVFLAILGISWFWLYGALFLTQFPAYAKNVLGGNENTVTLFLVTFSVGIGVGSLLCERLSGKHLEIGLVPLGSMGLTLFGIDLSFASPVAPVGTAAGISVLLANFWMWRILFDLLLIGIFGGIFIVPLYALVQIHSPESHRARIMAANNILNAIFIVVGLLGAAALLGSKVVTIPVLFGIAAIGNLIVALYIFVRAPEFLRHFIAWVSVRVH